MATWVTHLRVAERLAERLGIENLTEFYVGSIAPDSGKMINNFTYVPTKDVSHWKREGVTYEQRFEDNADFYRTYCIIEKNRARYDFLLGYYIHVLTDTIYVRDIIYPYMDSHGRDYWKSHITEIRDGWYQIDYRFLADNPHFRPLELIGEVREFENDYFDYFAPEDITERVRFAAELYRNGKPDYTIELLTHTERDAVDMIEYMVDEILQILFDKHGIVAKQ